MSLPFTKEITYTSSALCNVVCHPDGYLRLDWKNARATSAEVRETYQQVAAALKRYGLRKILSIHDHRQPIPLDVQKWMTDEWIPSTVLATGWAYCAVVESHQPLTRLAVKAIISVSSQQLTFHYSSAVEEGIAWLRSHN
ncbi:hypothetical protein [Hymenobacter jejuensis]|uniref:STAS/SEC14 domain-containing protein n=1 Tax=Hymenobacter jejuensis TaxID=2502781 RepID=A0A5B8A2E8_9BACT|nr:hypothetical protein [Hymenobacter jejuensis]QDA61564.1 hypothetical protein FHG12_16310 [Hymenobacter jejuensis]